MTKTELISALAKRHRRPAREYAETLDDILALITDQLARGKSVRLTGFGTFTTVERKAGSVRSVRTGEPIAIAAHRRPHFRAGDLLRRAVRDRG